MDSNIIIDQVQPLIKQVQKNYPIYYYPSEIKSRNLYAEAERQYRHHIRNWNYCQLLLQTCLKNSNNNKNNTWDQCFQRWDDLLSILYKNDPKRENNDYRFKCSELSAQKPIIKLN